MSLDVNAADAGWLELRHRKNWRRHLSALLSSAKARRDVSISVEDVFAQLEKQGFRCYYTGRPLSLSAHGKDNAVSMDRLDNSKGYVRGNVVLTTWGVNRLKGTADHDSFIEMCKAVAAYHK